MRATPDDTSTSAQTAPRRPPTPSSDAAVAPAGRRRAPLALAAAVTTGWAAIVSLTPVLALVLLVRVVSGTGTGTGSALRVGLAGWLLAHGVPLRTAAGPVGLAPLALTAFAAWRMVRAGVHTTRAVGWRRSRSVSRALLAGGTVGVASGLLGGAVAGLVSAPGLRVAVPRAAGTLAAFGLVAGVAGALRETGGYAVVARRVPPPLRDALRTGVVAALLVLAAGAAAAGTAIALSGREASAMLSEYRTGPAGQVGLTLLCLAYAPDLAVWAAAYLVGPGFTVGAGTVVSAGHVTIGGLPAVPALAGLPSRPVGGWGALLLGVPLAAGMAAGWLLARRLPDGAAHDTAAHDAVHDAAAWGMLLGSAALAGPVAGLALGLAAVAAGGPLGGGRLASVGPPAVQLASVGAGLVAAGAVLAAAATRALMGYTKRGPA